MKLLTRRIPFAGASEGRFNLYPIGDIHLGSAACDEKALKNTINKIADDPHAMVIIMGDVIDAIGGTGFDPRFRRKTLARWLQDIDDEDDIFDAELEYAVAALHPIAPKIVAMVCGNHEDSVEKHHGTNIYWRMVDRLAQAGGQKVADIAIGYDGFITLRFACQTKGNKSKPHVWSLPIFLHHGFGGGKMPGSKANNLWQLMATYDADLHLVGHTHDLMTVSRQVVKAGRHSPEIKTRWGVVCGSFHAGFIPPSKRGRPRETYSEVKGFPPLPIGHPVIRIDAARETYSVEQGGL